MASSPLPGLGPRAEDGSPPWQRDLSTVFLASVSLGTSTEGHPPLLQPLVTSLCSDKGCDTCQQMARATFCL